MKNLYSIFFVNKYNWIDKNPMTTISTFSTYALAELGHETTLIVSGDKHEDSESILKNYYGLSPQKKFTVQIFKRSQNKIFNSSIVFYLKAIKYIFKNKRKNTIVITRNTTFLPYLIFLRLLGVLTIFESHGYHGKLSPSYLPRRSFKKLINASGQYHFYEKLFLNKIDGLVCITTPQMQLYQDDFLKIPAVFLPLGSKRKIEIKDLPSSQALYKRKRLIYIGRYTNHIDIEILFSALKNTSEEISFVWLGLKEHDFEILEKFIEKYSIQSKVELKVWVSHNEMQKFILEKASVGIALYKNTFRSAAVTSPSKIFDYFSLGLPVIAPDMANIRDIIENGKNGLLYDPAKPESLSMEISNIFSSIEHFEKFRTASIKSSEKFSWNRRAKSLTNFINNLEVLRN